MKTYNISVEVVCQGTTEIWNGSLKGYNKEEVQNEAFQILQNKNEYKKHLNSYEVVKCEVVEPKYKIDENGIIEI